MMLELYHAEPHGDSLRVLICLEEKGLEYTGHFLDVFALEPFRLPRLQVDASGEVPLLMREGIPYVGASAICELLDEAHPQPPLMPADAHGRWAARVWQKYVDDGVAPSIGELAWHAYGARSLPLERRAVFSEAVEECVPLDQRGPWRAALRGYPEEQLARARARVDEALGKVEAALGRSLWLAGATYSLADTAVFSFFKYLPVLCPERLSRSATPRTLRWLQTISERPAPKAALARGRAADPFTVASPPAPQIRWG